MGQSSSRTTQALLRRPIYLTLFLFLALYTTFHLFASETNPATFRNIGQTLIKQGPLMSAKYMPDRYASSIQTEEDRMEVLARLYEDERLDLLRDYNQIEAEGSIRTLPGALNPDFNMYISRLENFIQTYFNGSIHQPMLLSTIDHLVHAQPPRLDGKSGFGKKVISFEKDGRDGVPGEFNYWEKRMPDWEVVVGNDEDMEGWFGEATQEYDGEVLGERGENGGGAGLWRELWEGLERPVLKADLLRYIMMLTTGGMYTDSDTAPLSNINLWGINAHILTPPGLRTLSRAMSSIVLPPVKLDRESTFHVGSNRFELDGDGGDAAAQSLNGDGGDAAALSELEQLDMEMDHHDEAKLGINNPKISLVISVEYDLDHPRQDPRFGYTRDLQMVQWTFMAKPGHPIFLDVLETASRSIMERRSAGAQDSWQTVLDSTGPGPFTDAVLRYLLVQYGVTPQQLRGMEDGALIGDILILPLHAFGSFLGGEEDWNAHDPSTRCLAHGFRGRWKGDMGSGFRKRGMEGRQVEYKD